VVLFSLLVGVGIVVVFSLGLAGLSFARNAERSRGFRTLGVALLVVTAGALVGALWWGFVIVATKS
jgi:hypothetical protein